MCLSPLHPNVGLHPEALLLHWAFGEAKKKNNKKNTCGFSFPHIGIMMAASLKMWVSRNAEGERMRCPFFFFFTPLSLRTPSFRIALRVGAYTSTRERENQWRFARLGSLLQEKISALIGCRLTFSPGCVRIREVLSESSPSQNKTSNYSYPVWRRIKWDNSALHCC